MAVMIQKVTLDDANRVTSIEFYVDSNPREVLEFLRDHNLGNNFSIIKDEEVSDQSRLTEVGGIHGIIDKNGKFNPL